MQKLKSILLIDDNLHDNFFHELVIKELDCAEEVISIQNPLEGLAYLLSKNESSSPFPDLIFLDINMPKMNGFELLKAYKQQKTNVSDNLVVIMLTTSLNPEDEKKASEFEEIALFATKPLDEKLLNSILSNKKLEVKAFSN